MALVKAMAVVARSTVVCDGADTVMDFGHDALGDGGEWLDVRPYTTLSIYTEFAGATGTSFTVKGKHTEDGAEFDVVAKAAFLTGAYILDGTAATGTLGNVAHLSYVRVYQDGADTETQTVEIVGS